MLELHISLALLSVTGFLLRAGWAFTAPDLLQQRWVRIAPHVVDSLLLAAGVYLALHLPEGAFAPWLLAKWTALIAYIGFGVMTLRASGVRRMVGLVGALTSVAYIFVAAATRSVWPF